jgi:hypothetical protein
MSGEGKPMAGPLSELVRCWMAWGGIDSRLAPDPVALERGLVGSPSACRPGARVQTVVAWEDRHGYRLPAGLRAWLMLSDGLFAPAPLVHPIDAIGPMIPFARFTGMIVQPESWFELGNPREQTVCIDMAYRLPEGGFPIFTSGDDASGSAPVIIARSFEEWFLELLRHGGHEYWFDAGFVGFGDPWQSHRRHAPRLRLHGRLRSLTQQVSDLLDSGTGEREIASRLEVSPQELELIFRHLQQIGTDRVPSPAAGTD